MIATLRSLFLGRPAREKILILLLLIAIAGIWCSSFVARAGAFASSASSTSDTLAEQGSLIGRKDRIEKAAQEQASHLDRTKTLDTLRLNSTVQNIARDAGLTGYNIAPGEEIKNGNFAFHTVTFSVTKATWESVENFYYRLQARAPYIGIESFSLLADRSNPSMLNASMSITSVEILPSSP